MSQISDRYAFGDIPKSSRQAILSFPCDGEDLQVCKTHYTHIKYLIMRTGNSTYQGFSLDGRRDYLTPAPMLEEELLTRILADRLRICVSERTLGELKAISHLVDVGLPILEAYEAGTGAAAVKMHQLASVAKYIPLEKLEVGPVTYKDVADMQQLTDEERMHLFVLLFVLNNDAALVDSISTQLVKYPFYDLPKGLTGRVPNRLTQQMIADLLDKLFPAE